MSKGWYGDKQQHSLASKGIKSACGINKDNVVNYIMEYETGSLSEEDMIEFFAYFFLGSI